MKIERVVDFRTFQRLNEAEEQSGSAAVADQLVELFFLIYSSLVSKVDGGYADAISDLQNLAKMGATEKGDGMLEIVTKVAKVVNVSYKEAASEMILATKKVKEAYDAMVEQMKDKSTGELTDDGKKKLEDIKNKIYDTLITQFIDKLKDSAQKAKQAKDEIKESIQFSKDDALLEKVFDRFFTEERTELVSKITPFFTTVVNLAANSPSSEMKSECTKLASDLKKSMEILQGTDPEFKWEEKKRRDRKAKLDEIADEINDIPNKIMEIQTKALLKLGIDNKIKELITAAKEAIKRAMETLNKEEDKKLEASAEKKSEQAKEDKEGRGEEKGGDKEGNKKEIVSGTVDVNNLKKSGSNRDAIKSAQEKINLLLPGDEKIKPDGLYGKNTEKAIKTISAQFSALDPSIKGLDGKKMTPEFRKFLDNFEKNKDKIAAFFKKS